MTVASDSDNLMILINPEAITALDDHAAAFAGARPFRHVVIDQFLEKEFCAEICAQFPSFDRQKAVNEDGVVGGKAVQESVAEIAPAFRQLDALVQQPEFLDFVGRITGIDGLEYDPHYFGGGTHENLHGQDLDPHIDFNFHPISRKHRRLNLIIYLNAEWEDAWGGSLQLHLDPYKEVQEDEIVTVTPLMNRCVIFETTEHSWHGFERIDLPQDKQHLSRRSFALYFYTRERPTAETGPEHSTVYVERHLPERFRAGMTLTEDDLQEIRILLARRDQHLRRLYGQVADLMTRLNRPWQQATAAALRSRIHELEASTSWRITAPLRRIKQMFSGAESGGDKKQ